MKMKKLFAGLAAAALFVSVGATTVFASDGGAGPYYQDANGDGVCDRRAGSAISWTKIATGSAIPAALAAGARAAGIRTPTATGAVTITARAPGRAGAVAAGAAAAADSADNNTEAGFWDAE